MSRTPISAPSPPYRQRSFLNQLLWGQGRPGELVIYSHSNLFYWWPVWLTSFIMAGITYFQGQYIAIVPRDTLAAHNRLVQTKPNDPESLEKRDVLILAPNATLRNELTAQGEEDIVQPHVLVSRSRSLGVILLVVLLVVTWVTNVPLRGLWSLLAVISIILLSIIFAAAGWWDQIFHALSLLAIHMNMGGYLTLGLSLFVLWLVNVMFFDRQIYMIFTPGQVRLRLEMGGGETVYDTIGMVFQKQRADLFRHWFLGFGSGDLVIRPAGGHQHIDLPNVLSVGRRVRQIEQMLKEKAVVSP
jgi:hypothetical protein